MKLIDVALSSLVPGLVLVHLLVAPYTKVEESFSIQATHDVLVYGTPTSDISEKLHSSYDHFTFPGAVPRTFLGPVLLAGISQPIVAAVGFDHSQFIVRALLGLFNASCLLYFKHNLERAFGASTARWYTLLQASQFHVIFYASRTLPNMFAFGLTTLAFAFLLPMPSLQSVHRRQRLCIALFVLAGVIFRSEVALLLATSVLYLLFTNQTTLPRIISPFAVSFIMSLLISVPIDSYFWQKPLWPELWGFYYNAILGSSSNWGISPWHYYFTSALPRILLNPLVPVLLIPTAMLQPATSRAARQLVIPPLLFAAIYSIQPHKEARFIFYVAPPLTAAAALGANFFWVRRAKSAPYALATAAVAASIALTFAISTAILLLSALNYPGGEALAHLHSHLRSAADAGLVSVHADVLSCMTGVTLFGTATGAAMPTRRGTGAGAIPTTATAPIVAGRPAGVHLALDKTEDPTQLRDPAFWTRFDYVLTEDPAAVRGGTWETVGVVEAYAGVEVLRPGAKAAGAGQDPELGGKVVGHGAVVGAVREVVRRLTGGWWVGPRMLPSVRIMKRVKDRGRGGGRAVEA